MTRNKQLRKQIASLRNRRDEHLEKVAEEASKENPRWDVIEHWVKEIQNFERQIEEMEQELQKNRRGGLKQ
ncbi:MAG: hypothetical protein Q6370_016395 [Candidatus Sigynarchaeota archaeon]